MSDVPTRIDAVNVDLVTTGIAKRNV